MSTTEFTTKDSGNRIEWETGSRRDVEDGKLDYSLLPYKALARLVGLYMRGAEKYGRYNWQKGQDMARVDRSLSRHFAQYMNGERDEDHLAAITWNAICLMDHEDRIQSGDLPATIDTRDQQRKITPPPIEGVWGDLTPHEVRRADKIFSQPHLEVPHCEVPHLDPGGETFTHIGTEVHGHLDQ